MSEEYNITAEVLEGNSFRALHAGDDYDHKFIIVRMDSALNLNAAKVWFTIKESSVETDPEAKLQLTSDSSGEIDIVDADNGEFVVKFRGIGPKNTANLEGLWQYDIQVLLSGGSIMTVSRGLIEFLPNITRATI